MSRCRLQKREALTIASKLGCSLEPDGKHQLATFEYNGVIILTFGIRHGGSGGHGHLVGRYGNLRLNETRAMQLASCTMSKDEYIQHLIDIGEIPADEDGEE